MSRWGDMGDKPGVFNRQHSQKPKNILWDDIPFDYPESQHAYCQQSSY
jgi:hypothetical protein